MFTAEEIGFVGFDAMFLLQLATRVEVAGDKHASMFRAWIFKFMVAVNFQRNRRGLTPKLYLVPTFDVACERADLSLRTFHASFLQEPAPSGSIK